MQVGIAGGNDVDEEQTDTALKTRRTLGREGVARLATVLVAGADQLDDGHQHRAVSGVEDAYLDVVGETPPARRALPPEVPRW